jgi:hypothetical protein
MPSKDGIRALYPSSSPSKILLRIIGSTPKHSRFICVRMLCLRIGPCHPALWASVHLIFRFYLQPGTLPVYVAALTTRKDPNCDPCAWKGISWNLRRDSTDDLRSGRHPPGSPPGRRPVVVAAPTHGSSMGPATLMAALAGDEPRLRCPDRASVFRNPNGDLKHLPTMDCFTE